MKGIVAAACLAGALGFGLGWLSRGDGEAPVIADPDHAGPVSRERPSAGSAVHQDRAGVRARLADIQEAARRGRRFEGEFSTLELAALCDELVAGAGIGGLAERDLEVLEFLIGRWHDADPEGILAWVLSEQHERSRGLLGSKLVGFVMKDDFDAAVGLIEEHFTGTDFPPPFGFVSKLREQDVQGVVRAIKAMVVPQNDHGIMGWTLSGIDDGFDFETALDELAEAHQELPKDSKFAAYPGLLAEWAKVDPQAALEWALGGNDLPFNKGLPDFLRGYAEVSGPEELGALGSQRAESDRPVDERNRMMWEVVEAKPQIETVRALFENLPHGIDPDAQRLGMLQGGIGQGGFRVDEARMAILGSLPAESQLDFVARNQEAFGSRIGLLYTPLRQLGHSQATIDEALER